MTFAFASTGSAITRPRPASSKFRPLISSFLGTLLVATLASMGSPAIAAIQPSAGLAPLAGGAPAPAADKVNGVVWDDYNTDGVNDASEDPLAGVTVQLLNSAGTVVDTATTNASGIYTLTVPGSGGPFKVRIPSAPTLFIVTPSGADQDFTQGSLPNVGLTAGFASGGVTFDAALRPQWTTDLGTWGTHPTSGTVPFQTDPSSTCPGGAAPGDDCSNTDAFIRSGDKATFNWSVSASNTEGGLPTTLSNVTLIQRIVPVDGAQIYPGALPTACSGTGNPTSQSVRNPDGSVTLICNLGALRPPPRRDTYV